MRIADVTVSLSATDPNLKLKTDGPTRDFLVDPAPSDVVVEASWSDPAEVREGRKLFDSGGVWQLHRVDGLYRFEFRSTTARTNPYKVAYFAPDFKRGTVYLNRRCLDTRRPIYPLEYPLDELILVGLLSNGAGVEVHACGLTDTEGNGYLFLGHSGAGKTTTAMLWRKFKGVRILSDDRIILRRPDKSFVIYGTPWHGEAELASPISMPLTRIYFLRHGPENKLVPVTGAAAVGRLFSCAFPPFYNHESLDFTLAFFEALVAAVPCAELSFVPDERSVQFILASP